MKPPPAYVYPEMPELLEGTRTLNKMTKGAIVTAAGVMLLVGGGGTLALWNEEVNAAAGTVEAGDLDLVTDPGVWTVEGQQAPIEDIEAYRVVPGDKLTYTQKVDVVLEGNNIAATLSVVNPNDVETGFINGTYNVSDVTLLDSLGAPIANQLDENDDLTDAVASVTFEFLDTTENRDSVNATYDFSAVAFQLEQIDPVVVP